MRHIFKNLACQFSLGGTAKLSWYLLSCSTVMYIRLKYYRTRVVYTIEDEGRRANGPCVEPRDHARKFRLRIAYYLFILYYYLLLFIGA